MSTSTSGAPGCTCQNAVARRPRTPMPCTVVVGRSAGDQAVVDLDDVVRPVLAHPAPPAGQLDVALPGPPAQSVARGSPGTASTVTSTSSPASRDSCSRTTSALSDRCRASVDVLEVAAPASARTGVRARRVDPVRRGLQHLDGVAAPEPVSVGPLGDLDDDPLAGQRVPHEDHPTRAVGGVQPGDAVAAVGDRAPPRRRTAPRPGTAPAVGGCGGCGRAAAQPDVASVRDRRRSLDGRWRRRSTSPRRRSPGRTRYSSRSSRSRAISDERSW